MSFDLRHIAEQFETAGPPLRAQPYGNGHINDSFDVPCEGGRYLLQRLNHNVFPDPVGLMKNAERVTRHIRREMEASGNSDIDRRVLTVVPCRDGASYFLNRDGNYWRMLLFINNAQSYDRPPSPEHAFEAAQAFGRFAVQLDDLPGPPLVEVIPHFHDTPHRYGDLERAIDLDPCNRASRVRKEIDFVLERQGIAGTVTERLATGELPLRNVHNDTKLNNVLFDSATDKALCVVDLDTVMAGSPLYDFADLVRSGACFIEEDARDLSRIAVNLKLFEGLARGYLSAAGDWLTTKERELMAFSGKLISLEVGVRFLTDFLEGDHYFKIRREDHNRDRCRTQFKLVESIEAHEDEMNRIVAGIEG